jgi:hypothetical protein
VPAATDAGFRPRAPAPTATVGRWSWAGAPGQEIESSTPQNPGNGLRRRICWAHHVVCWTVGARHCGPLWVRRAKQKHQRQAQRGGGGGACAGWALLGCSLLWLAEDSAWLGGKGRPGGHLKKTQPADPIFRHKLSLFPPPFPRPDPFFATPPSPIRQIIHHNLAVPRELRVARSCQSTPDAFVLRRHLRVGTRTPGQARPFSLPTSCSPPLDEGAGGAIWPAGHGTQHQFWSALPDDESRPSGSAGPQPRLRRPCQLLTSLPRADSPSETLGARIRPLPPSCTQGKARSLHRKNGRRRNPRKGPPRG